MLKFRMPLSGTYSSVIRPIAIGIINDIKELLYVDPDIRVKLSNQIEEFITNEQFDPMKLESNTPHIEDIKFSVEEEFNEDTLITTALNYNDYRPIIYDADIGAYIRPIYVDSKLVFNIKYRNKSKVKVNNIVNMLKLNLADNALQLLHNVEYMFYIPEQLIELFLDINIRKNYVVDPEVPFEDYLISISDGRLTAVGGLNGKLSTFNIAAKETQHDIIGQFETSIVNLKGEYDDSNSMWEATFSYNVMFEKPVALYIKYPPLIYNTLLPKKYIITRSYNKNKQDKTLIKTILGERRDIFENGSRLVEIMKKQSNQNKLINLPQFDDFKPSYITPYYNVIFTVLCAVTHDDKRALFNLKEIPEYKITDDLIEFLEASEYEYATRAYNSIFYIELYENDIKLKDTYLTIDNLLNIRATVDLDLTKTYRIGFSILTDAIMAQSGTVNRLLQFKEVFHKVLSILEIRPGVNVELLDDIQKTKIYHKPGHKMNYTVMVANVLALDDDRERK